MRMPGTCIGDYKRVSEGNSFEEPQSDSSGLTQLQFFRAYTTAFLDENGMDVLYFFDSDKDGRLMIQLLGDIVDCS